MGNDRAFADAFETCRVPFQLRNLSPYSQRTMRRRQNEVVIGRQHDQLMTNAKLREHGVNSADLQAGATTAISQFRGFDVILPVWRQKRQGRETLNNVLARPRAGESLQQFLQNQSRGHDGIATFKSIA